MIFLRRSATFLSRPAIQRTHYHAFSSLTGLGLRDSPLVQSVRADLEQLPEVQAFLQHPDRGLPKASQAQWEGLKRAHDIFASHMPECSRAVLALQAEVEVASGQDATRTLEQITDDSSHHSSLVQLATAKAYWLQGEFDKTAELCEALCMMNEGEDAGFQAAARNGFACAKLMQASSLDDLYSVKEPFRKNVNVASQTAATHLNMGCAEAIYGKVLQELRPNADVMYWPAALKAWKQALTLLKKKKNKPSLELVAHLNANMAYGLLQLGETEKASDHAQQSLQAAEQLSPPSSLLNRTLHLVASCYHQSGGAVTAEGLYQSAVDMKHLQAEEFTLYDKLFLREALNGYAVLCDDWDKRAGDAEKLREQSKSLEIPVTWKNWPVYSSLWFWMPNQL